MSPCHLAVALLLLAAGGCATCPGPHDWDHSAFGGLWERHEACRGSVASAFTPEVGSPRRLAPAEIDATPMDPRRPPLGDVPDSQDERMRREFRDLDDLAPPPEGVEPGGPGDPARDPGRLETRRPGGRY